MIENIFIVPKTCILLVELHGWPCVCIILLNPYDNPVRSVSTPGLQGRQLAFGPWRHVFVVPSQLEVVLEIQAV